MILLVRMHWLLNAGLFLLNFEQDLDECSICGLLGASSEHSDKRTNEQSLRFPKFNRPAYVVVSMT